LNPWRLAVENGLGSVYRPLYFQPLYIPGNMSLKELPAGFLTLELSSSPPQPGRAIGLRGVRETAEPLAVTLGTQTVNSFANGSRIVGLMGTGAFLSPGDYGLTFVVGDNRLWSQPVRFVAGEWTFSQVTLTGEAAEIDAESIRQERERLFAIWNLASPAPQWTAAFQLPIESYLEISSLFGARRSYNGGPFSSYHEGVDFSAYGGTPVYASAAGTVVIAERLYVRGGAVIIDHGLGIYTGVYHLSEVAAQVGQVVEPGQLVGNVGTTGLSTGNHLHWDLLVGGVWVDAAAWVEQDMACWVLEGWGTPC
jgi:murein DD-endopeptidase MepM/ murein hydrolase activator NlpD